MLTIRWTHSYLKYARTNLTLSTSLAFEGEIKRLHFAACISVTADIWWLGVLGMNYVQCQHVIDGLPAIQYPQVLRGILDEFLGYNEEKALPGVNPYSIADLSADLEKRGSVVKAFKASS